MPDPDAPEHQPSRDAPIRRVLPPLFAIQFCTWLGLFCLWIFAVPVVTRTVFAAGEVTSRAYQRGLLWVSGGFAFYSLLAASLAFALPRLVARHGRPLVHAGALSCGALGLWLLGGAASPGALILPFAGIGIAVASISNTPYAIVSNAAPPDRIQHFMHIFAFSTVIPQAVAVFLLNWLLNHWFGGDPALIMRFGGLSMGLGAILSLLFRRRLGQG
jgi:maltose/moltooligosaccharide transporter